MNYKALLYKNNKFLYKKIVLPKPKNNQIFVKNHYTGICGSDLHNVFDIPLRGNFKKWESLEFADGHELCGEIINIGKKVKKFKIGDRVVSEAVYHCKNCVNCRNFKHQICLNRKDIPWLGHGGFSQVSFIDQNSAYKVPKKLKSDIAALSEPLASVIHAFNKVKNNKNDKILIYGAGTIGLLLLRYLKFKSYKNAFIVARHKHQKNIAQKKIKKNIIISEKNFTKLKNNFDIIYECTGSENAMNMSLQLIKKGGNIVCLGTTSKSVKLNYQNIINKEINLIGSLCYGTFKGNYEMEIALKTLLNKKFYCSDLISHQISFGEAVKAFKIASNKKYKSIKVQFEF
jgi:L-iditol 2-dehydrogenase